MDPRCNEYALLVVVGDQVIRILLLRAPFILNVQRRFQKLLKLFIPGFLRHILDFFFGSEPHLSLVAPLAYLKEFIVRQIQINIRSDR